MSSESTPQSEQEATLTPATNPPIRPHLQRQMSEMSTTAVADPDEDRPELLTPTLSQGDSPAFFSQGPDIIQEEPLEAQDPIPFDTEATRKPLSHASTNDELMPVDDPASNK